VRALRSISRSSLLRVLTCYRIEQDSGLHGLLDQADAALDLYRERRVALYVRAIPKDSFEEDQTAEDQHADSAEPGRAESPVSARGESPVSQQLEASATPSGKSEVSQKPEILERYPSFL